MTSKTTGEVGPVYGVKLIDTLPLGTGCLLQQMPSRSDLIKCHDFCVRVAAGYEVLLAHYQQLLKEKETQDG